MTAAEKAYDLILKFQFKQEGIRKELAKRQALIAVDEILTADMFMMTEEQEEFWENVKKEIAKK